MKIHFENLGRMSLSAICNTIERDLKEMLGEKNSRKIKTHRRIFILKGLKMDFTRFSENNKNG